MRKSKRPSNLLITTSARTMSRLSREFAPDVPVIHADRQQLRQLFLNLFTNASDAMPEGGTLTIRVMAHT